MSDRSSGKSAATQSGEIRAPASGDPASAPEAARRRARLIRTIEGDIIPRLLISLSGSLTTVREGHYSAAAADFTQLQLAARLLGEISQRDDCRFDELLAGLNLLKSVIQKVSAGTIGSDVR